MHAFILPLQVFVMSSYDLMPSSFAKDEPIKAFSIPFSKLAFDYLTILDRRVRLQLDLQAIWRRFLFFDFLYLSRQPYFVIDLS